MVVKDRCISEEDMFRFLNNRMEEEEVKIVETHLKKCKLCSEGIEGIRSFLARESPEKLQVTFSELKERITDLRAKTSGEIPKPSTTSPGKRWLWISTGVAAAILILVVIGFGIRFAVKQHDLQRIRFENAMKEQAGKIDFNQAQYLPPPMPEGTEQRGQMVKPVYIRVEEMPSFPGGDQALHAFLTEHILCETGSSTEEIPGSLFVNFVVEEDGTITNVRLVSETGNKCIDETIQGIEAMPKWIPGKMDGKRVRVSYMLMLKFS